ncbi:transglycosylase SLT domain-containing protein [Asticcacaulis taihuensis]|uniref:transglycosylase SLT domain-containing protein n=1 Tax=Asticcacaulis taihuensis TaxID=260084 RepID=UPI0026EC193B|nr:transglycosylase SLT domain-containing protein [Asticcacaulis taihuensis]
MPDLSIYKQPFDPNGFNRAVTFGSGGTLDEARRVVGEDAQITPYVSDWLDSRNVSDGSEKLDAATLNQEYGVDGYLKFDKADTRASADYKARVANRHMYRDQTLSSYQLSPGDTIWQSLKGGALDPVTIPTWFFGVGEMKALGAGAEGVMAIGRNRLILSGMARGATDNLIGGAVVEGANYGLKRAADEEYDFGQAADNLTIGAIFGAGLGGVGGHLRYGGARKAAQRANLDGVISTAAEQFGEDPGFMARMAQVESGLVNGRPGERSSARGLFQFMPNTWKGLGGGNIDDAALQAERAAKMAADNRAALTASLGRPAEDWEVYLAHQQGLGGARSLLANPERRAADVVGGVDKVVANGGRADMTAGEFAALWRDRFNGEPGAAGGASPASGLPGAVELLSPSERAGINEMFLDYLMDDSRADLSALLPTDARPLRRAAAGTDFHLSMPGRVFEDDVAVTTRGREIPVKYAVVDIKDLVTSHDNDLNPSGAYPQELQPRARDRAGAVTRNQQLENEMNPRRLMGSVDAESGTPIIGRDGVVESGNGRTIALRRSAQAGGEAYGRYLSHLKTQGYDLEGIEHPVLVRVNASDMSHGERIRWTKEANNDTVERMGAGETARSDAAKLPHDALALIEGPDLASAGNRAFVQAFIKHAAPDATNSLTNAAGEISADAVRRIKAALLQRAYDNPRLVERLFEDADPNIKSIGNALQNAAPGFARLKGLIALGRVSPEADLSADLNRALDLVMEARDGLVPLRDIVAERIDQVDMISGDAMSEAQIGLLRAMFKDADYRVGRSVDDLTRMLDAYSRQAAEVSGEVDLLGNSALEQVRESLQSSLQLADRAITLGDKRVFTFRPDGGLRGQDAGNGAVREALGLGGDAGGGPRSRPDTGGQGPADSSAGRGSAADAGRSQAESVKPKVNTAALIAADPELKALADDIKALDPEGENAPALKEKPETVAEAFRAVAFCMIEGGVSGQG